MPGPRPPVHLVTHEFTPNIGGAGVYCQALAEGADHKGFPITVWAAGKIDRGDTAFPFKVKRMGHRGSQGWEARFGLLRTALGVARSAWLNPDHVVHVAEPGALAAWLYLQMHPRLRQVRPILTFHGSEILRFSSLGHRRHLMRQLIGRASRIAVLSRNNRDLLRARYPEANGKVILTPGAPRKRAEPKPSELPARPKRAEVVILTVGRIHPRKGQLRLIEALTRLKKKWRKEIALWIVGPVVKRDYFRAVKAAARDSGVDVIFHHGVSEAELTGFYRQADIFALTSVPTGHSIEGLGLVYLEAAAEGLPVVAHETGGVADAVVDEQTGLLVSPDDLEGLTTALKRLIKDAKLREQMGRSGQAFARQFSWEAMACQLYGDL
ncbi:MAG: glycosyltransferase family 4 protein [Opitutales bacterium]